MTSVCGRIAKASWKLREFLTSLEALGVRLSVPENALCRGPLVGGESGWVGGGQGGVESVTRDH